VGRLLAQSGRTIVYGGGRVGMMGALADAALAAGGQVIGVIPQSLVDKELAHPGVELRIVQSMHERKALMAELSDAFLTLPGGIGTLEEFFETWTWGQLGLHAKPYAVLDVEGVFQPLLQALDHLVNEQFLRPEHRAMLLVEREADNLIAALAAHRPGYMPKWIDRRQT
jgi:uncharacterized protein (TIGR00730 family)